MAQVLIPLAIGSAAASIYGGYQANQSARREASALDAEGQLAQTEANREAQLQADDARKFSRTQSLAFLKNGVTLAGSPLLIAEDTLTRAQEEVDATVRSGDASARLYSQKAQQTRNMGRAALIGGFTGAASSGTSTYIQGHQAGIF